MAAPHTEEREDFLTEDPDVPGQKFCLLSFLSPERVLANKDIFFFEKFLQGYEFNYKVESFEKFLMTTAKGINDRLNTYADKLLDQDLSGAADIVLESRVRVDILMDAFQTFVKERQSDLKASKLKESYDEFMFKNRTKLEDEFYAKNDFRTTVRGVKIRGSYSSHEEAVARSKKLQRTDPVHNIFVGEVGKWLPWDPEPSDIKEQEYAEDKLNTLMKKYRENEEAREAFEREKRETATKSARRNKTVDLTGAPSEADAAAVSGPVKEEEFNGIFSTEGPADLAIARKMENKLK